MDVERRHMHNAPWTRRQFLTRATAAAAGVAAARMAGLPVGPEARAASRFTNPVFRPETLTGELVELHATVTSQQIFPGDPTTLWTFNGTFPGPTIRRPAGARTVVRVHHQLPAEVGTLTVHHHGGHTASQFDGQPERFVIEPGSFFDYEYELMEDGAPERGALQWYHDHSHFNTSRNVWMGLAGMFVIEDADEFGLPSGPHDIELMIADRIFDGNQLAPIGDALAPFDDLAYNSVLVNGTANPFLEVEPRPYRLRFLSASNFRPFNLVLPGVGRWTQIGTEGGLLPGSVERDAILLGPAERAEVVVDFSGHAGETLVLGSTFDDRQRSTAPAVEDLLEIRVAAGAGQSMVVPRDLRPLPAWVASASTTPDRVWTFGIGTDEAGSTAWTINGRAFDHDRIDARVELGSVETWMLVNTTPIATSHFIHIHLADWYVLSRNGEAPEAGESGLKETFRLDPGEVLVIAARFTDHLGPYMIHCHMLEHEDHGMMTAYEVVPEGEGDLGTNPVPGITSVPGELGAPLAAARVAGQELPVRLGNMTPQAARQTAEVLSLQRAAPGRPAAIPMDASTALPAGSVFCQLSGAARPV